jgi:predicted HicB family RNase H-like nuclease
MFIVKKPESFNKTVRMPDELIERLERSAASKDVSFNQLVVQCCEYALAHLPQQDQVSANKPG